MWLFAFDAISVKKAIPLIFIFACCGCSGVKYETIYWNNGSKALYYSLPENKMEGRIISWDVDGEVIADGTAKDDKYLDGSFVKESSKYQCGLVIARYSKGRLITEESLPDTVRSIMFIGKPRSCVSGHNNRIFTLEDMQIPPVPEPE